MVILVSTIPVGRGSLLQSSERRGAYVVAGVLEAGSVQPSIS